MKRVGVTGGIGGGKSVVSRFLRILGYSVYDSDEQAKALMARSSCIQAQLSAEFGADIYVGGVLNRTRLAEWVFADKAALQRLNACRKGRLCRVVSQAQCRAGTFYRVRHSARSRIFRYCR